MIGPVAAKVRWRLLRPLRWALLRALGRELRCASCGRPMFRAIPLVWKGRVTLLGAEEHNVRVTFGGKRTLELRHLMLDECPGRTRPWVR